MYADNNSRESLTGYSDGQLWLYRMMHRMYQTSGPHIAVPVAEIAGLMEYGAAAYRSDDQTFWRDGLNEAGSLPYGWFEREEAAERHFAQMGLVTMRVAAESPAGINN